MAMYTLNPHRTLAALHAPPSSVALTPSESEPTLRSTWTHRFWVTAGSATVLATLIRSAVAAAESNSITSPLLAALLGYLLADLGTGIYHWAIDNYGGLATPFFGPQIDAFQGHHRRPVTITRRQPANNLHVLARTVALAVPPIELATSGGSAAVHAFVGVCAGCLMLSQQFHAWAHTPRGRLPPAVAAMQEAGVLISPARHAAHHRPPYSNNYCIVSGVWNGFLDFFKVFELMEMWIFVRFRVRPRSWSEPGSEWTEEHVAVES